MISIYGYDHEQVYLFGFKLLASPYASVFYTSKTIQNLHVILADRNLLYLAIGNLQRISDTYGV